jgi:hypothetical protein
MVNPLEKYQAGQGVSVEGTFCSKQHEDCHFNLTTNRETADIRVKL